MPRRKQRKVAKPSLPQTLRGMRDILPQEEKYWRFVLEKATSIAEAYGYEQIETPILEETSLFVRSVGKGTDIVEKEMFSFVDKGGENICLRPEITASLCRAYIEHGMVNLPQPVKFYTIGPVFRHDRPQAGRFRQFHQIDLEILGSQAAVVDAELITVNYYFLKELGLDISLQINSIGCPSCRPAYRNLLVDYFRGVRRKLCENCKKRLRKNPLRLLDCKETTCETIAQDAPPMVDHLCEECRDHFTKVLEYLDEAEIPYNLDHRIVRGLDYYTKTAFEIYPILATEEKLDAQSALSGGGRYDNLIERLGGRPTPACGFAMGIERIILALKMKEVVLPEEKKPDIFLAQLGESARKKSLKLLEELRQGGLRARANLIKDNLSQQLAIADKLKIPCTLIIGQKEIIDKTIIIREMSSGSQEVIDIKKVVQEIKKRFREE